MNIALILAAGSSLRTNTDIPKQFVLINNKPILLYSFLTFNEVEEIEHIYVVTSEEYMTYVDELLKDYPKYNGVILGGETRQESVSNALDILEAKYDENTTILIHDSARANVSKSIILRNIEASKKYPAITTAIDVSDTISLSKDKETIESYLNRDELKIIQTPQTFNLKLLFEAHQKAKLDNITATDDTKIIQHFNEKIHYVEGSSLNFKITKKEDLEIFLKLTK